MKFPSFLWGGGVESIPPPFCTVLTFFLNGSFEDMDIFHELIYLSVMDRYISSKLPLKNNNLITFSIVIKNENG